MLNYDEYFKQNGYKRYNSNRENVVNLFQKTFYNENGEIKYHISIEEFGFNSSLYDNMPQRAKENYRFEYHVQLNSKDGGTTNINMFSSGWDINKVENQVKVLFDTGLFREYHLYN